MFQSHRAIICGTILYKYKLFKTVEILLLKHNKDKIVRHVIEYMSL